MATDLNTTIQQINNVIPQLKIDKPVDIDVILQAIIDPIYASLVAMKTEIENLKKEIEEIKAKQQAQSQQINAGAKT
jgi:hypothetical protein